MHPESLARTRSAEGAPRRGIAARPPPRSLHIPISLMAVVAAAGLIVLLALHREAGRVNDEIVTAGRPARELLGEVQFAFSRRIYALQEYLLTSDPRYLDTYRREAERLGELTAEMALLLEQAGLRLAQVYGDYDLSPFEEDSDSMIAVAERAP